MKTILRYLKNYRAGIVVALLLATTNQLFSLFNPLIFQQIIDRFANNAGNLSQPEFFKGVLLWLGLGVVTALISRIAKTLQDYKVTKVTEQAGAELYENAISHVLRLPFGALEDESSGKLLQKLRKARLDIANFIKKFIDTAFTALFGIVFVLIYSIFAHWSITLMFVVLIPVIAITTYSLSKSIKDKQVKITKKLSQLSGETTETLRNIEIVKSLGLEAQEVEHLNTTNQDILALEIEKVKTFRRMVFIQGTVINLSRTALEILLLALIFFGELTLGQYFTFLFYSFYIFNPLYELGDVVNAYREAIASGEIMHAVLDKKPEQEPKNAIDVTPFASLQCKGVSYQYPTSEAAAVHDVDFTVNAGSSVAFIGPSGSGKTTTLKLILGLYKPQSGHILINNHPNDQISYATLRGSIGYVSQETQLFSGTIRENLRFVAPGSTDRECLEALDKAQASHILDRGERKGLDTMIGENGIKLSGGERQRLAIARALLRKPQILIFDEATSSLDSITEQAITETIKAICKSEQNMTVIMVAHRLSTIAHADTIFVLEKGSIVESGNHDELLNHDGLYKALWRMQGAG